MNHLSTDILQEIGYHLDAISTCFLLSTCKDFWKKRNLSSFAIRMQPYKQSIRQRDWCRGSIISVEYNNIPQTIFFIENGASDTRGTLVMAGKKGHKEMLKLLSDIETWRKSPEMSSFDFIPGLSNDKQLATRVAYHRGHLDIVISTMNPENPQSALIAGLSANRKFVERFLDSAYREQVLNDALKGAAKYGHKDFIDWVISKGAYDWNLGLQGAASGGHMDLIQFFLNKGAILDKKALQMALSSKHIQVVKFFVKEGSVNLSECIEDILELAVKKNDRELVDSAIKLGAKHWGTAIIQAVKKSNVEMVKMFIWRETGLGMALLSCRCKSEEDKQIIKLLLEYEDAKSELCHLPGLALQKGTPEFAEWLVQQGAPVSQALVGAINENQEEFFYHMVEKHKTKIEQHTWDSLLVDAVRKRCRNIAYYVAENHSKNYMDALTAAVQSSHMGLVKFFVEKLKNKKTAPKFWNSLRNKATWYQSTDIIEYLMEMASDNWLDVLRETFETRKTVCKYALQKVMMEFGFIQEGTERMCDWQAGLDWAMANWEPQLAILCAEPLGDKNALLCMRSALGHYDQVQNLVEQGADDLNTALYYALYGEHRDVIRYLLEQGADNYEEAKDIAKELGIGCMLRGYIDVESDEDEIPKVKQRNRKKMHM